MGQEVKIAGYSEIPMMTIERYHEEWDRYTSYANHDDPEFIAVGAVDFIAEAKDLIIRER